MGGNRLTELPFYAKDAKTLTLQKAARVDPYRVPNARAAPASRGRSAIDPPNQGGALSHGMGVAVAVLPPPLTGCSPVAL